MVQPSVWRCATCMYPTARCHAFGFTKQPQNLVRPDTYHADQSPDIPPRHFNADDQRRRSNRKKRGVSSTLPRGPHSPPASEQDPHATVLATSRGGTESKKDTNKRKRNAKTPPGGCVHHRPYCAPAHHFRLPRSGSFDMLFAHVCSAKKHRCQAGTGKPKLVLIL